MVIEYCDKCGIDLELEEEKDIGAHINCSLTLVDYALSDDSQFF